MQRGQTALIGVVEPKGARWATDTSEGNLLCAQMDDFPKYQPGDDIMHFIKHSFVLKYYDWCVTANDRGELCTP